jgi:hypothetical protein
MVKIFGEILIQNFVGKPAGSLRRWDLRECVVRVGSG